MTSSDWVDVFAGIETFTAAVVAGGQILVLLVILPVIRSWPVGLSLKTHQAMLDALPDRYLPACTVASLAAAGALLALHDHLTATSTTLVALGVLGTLGVLVISIAVTRPASRRMAGWSPEAVPDTYPGLRARWDQMHALRTLLGTGAMVCYLTAALTI